VIGLLLAAIPLVPTPAPLISTPAPAPISERAVLQSGIDAAQVRARALGGTLGVTIVDATTGASAMSNGDANLPMGSVQNLIVAALTYRESETPPQDVVSRALLEDDEAAARELIGLSGGAEALNTELRALAFDAIFIAPRDGGYASSNALARFLTALAGGEFLPPAQTKSMLDLLARVQIGAGRLLAGLPPAVRLAHATGTTKDGTADVGVAYINGHTMIVVAMLHDARGSDADRDAVVAAAAQAATAAVRAMP
jgi:beta-lactamase class A